MILAVAATKFEMDPFLTHAQSELHSLICGVGPVESCYNLTRFLHEKASEVDLVINFGVAGAFKQLGDSSSPMILDICIAESEVLGDLGISFPHRIDELPADLVTNRFTLDRSMISRGLKILQENGMACFSGPFVTVNSVSGTEKRGSYLSEKFNGLCENMEGGALARVCDGFSLPMLQVRVISNYVEDRDTSNWSLMEACNKAGKVAAFLADQLVE